MCVCVSYVAAGFDRDNPSKQEYEKAKLSPLVSLDSFSLR